MPKLKSRRPARHRVTLCRDGCCRVINPGSSIAMPLPPLADAVPECLQDLLDAECEIAIEASLSAVLESLRPWQGLVADLPQTPPGVAEVPASQDVDPSCGLLLSAEDIRVISPSTMITATSFSLSALMGMPVALNCGPRDQRPTVRDVIATLSLLTPITA